MRPCFEGTASVPVLLNVTRSMPVISQISSATSIWRMGFSCRSWRNVLVVARRSLSGRGRLALIDGFCVSGLDQTGLSVPAALGAGETPLLGSLLEFRTSVFSSWSQDRRSDIEKRRQLLWNLSCEPVLRE